MKCRVLRQCISIMLVPALLLQSVLPAYSAEPGGKNRRCTYDACVAMIELTELKGDVRILHERIDKIAFVQGEMLASIVKMEDRREEIDKRLAALCQGDNELECLMSRLVTQVTEINDKTGGIAGKIDSFTAELKCINCTLSQVNCILCSLPGNIRRAKIRAFIFGFMVGMGVSAAISGGGGGAVGLSASIW